jgi:FAD/FMN-containing dehydrogenase
MSITTKLTSLKEVVSPDSTVLTDPKNDAFQELLKRWSDIDKQTPGAIVLPTSEDECQKIVSPCLASAGLDSDRITQVEWAVDASVPFVTKSGGHSSWSTIGSNGIIIDLSEYSGVEVDRAGKTATLIGGVSTKQAAVALAEEGLFTGTCSQLKIHCR